MSETVTFEETREARRVTSLLAREAADEYGWADAYVCGLIEAKRHLGMAIHDRWPEQLDAVLEEQG